MYRIATYFDKIDSVMGVFYIKNMIFLWTIFFPMIKIFFYTKKTKTLGKSTGAAVFVCCDFLHNEKICLCDMYLFVFRAFI